MPAWFANQQLLSPSKEVKEFVRRSIPTLPVPFARSSGNPWNDYMLTYGRQFPDSVEMGRLWWPTGAGRFGVYYGLVDYDTLYKEDGIRDNLYGFDDDASTWQDYDSILTICDNVHDPLSIQMWMLPPTPLSSPTLSNNLYLITLVDYRYWWWEKTLGDHSDGSLAEWGDIFGGCYSALFTDPSKWVIDSIPGDYPNPGRILSHSSGMPIPVMLDLAAASVGMRVSVDFDGTVRILGPTSAKIRRTSALSDQRIHSGGWLNMKTILTDGGWRDSRGQIPDHITIFFQKTLDPMDGYNPVTIDTQDVTGFDTYEPNTNGYNNLVFFSSYTTTDTGDRDAAALQIASDWLNYEAESNVDATIPGLVPLKICGMFDVVELVDHVEVKEHLENDPEEDKLVKREIHEPHSFTRVTRFPWNWHQFILCHDDAGSDVVTVTCPDDSQYTITFTGPNQITVALVP